VCQVELPDVGRSNIPILSRVNVRGRFNAALKGKNLSRMHQPQKVLVVELSFALPDAPGLNVEHRVDGDT
jgi:hypothetical protein